MRLFTALWVPDGTAAVLGIDTTAEAPEGWRFVDPSTWHVTLAFHGEADPGVLARRLDAAAHGASAPRVRLAGGGAFPGVRWAGVEAEPSLVPLVEAAGGDPARFVAHVTVLRQLRRPGPGAEREPSLPWSEQRGPWWRPAEVLLVASESGRAGPRYRPVHRVPLRGG